LSGFNTTQLNWNKWNRNRWYWTFVNRLVLHWCDLNR